MVVNATVESRKFRSILKRFLEGNASSEERSLVNRWYESFVDHGRQMHPHDNAKKEVWTRISTAIKKPDRLFSIPWHRVAAAVLLLVTIGAVSWLGVRNTMKKEETYSVFQTQVQERKEITLRDGSHLILNSGTRLRVSDDFSETRWLELIDGEVFFNVVRDPQRPFIVQSGLLQTNVLGTSFSIRTYPERNDISVSVLSGNVSITEGNTLLNVLTKGQHLVFNKADSTFTVTRTPPSATAWMEGKIILEDASFEEMTVLMHRHYGVVVKASEAQVSGTRYTATLRADMQPVKAMEVLAAIHGFNVRSKQDTIMLTR